MSLLEVGVLCSRNRCVLVGVIFVGVFSTNVFHPIILHVPVSDGSRPRRRENIGIVYSELDLEPISVTTIYDHNSRWPSYTAVFLLVLLRRLVRDFAIYQPETFHQMEGLAVWRT